MYTYKRFIFFVYVFYLLFTFYIPAFGVENAEFFVWLFIMSAAQYANSLPLSEFFDDFIPARLHLFKLLREKIRFNSYYGFVVFIQWRTRGIRLVSLLKYVGN